MLVLVQRVDGDDFFEECFVYATYFLLVDFEYTTVTRPLNTAGVVEVRCSSSALETSFISRPLR